MLTSKTLRGTPKSRHTPNQASGLPPSNSFPAESTQVNELSSYFYQSIDGYLKAIDCVWFFGLSGAEAGQVRPFEETTLFAHSVNGVRVIFNLNTRLHSSFGFANA